MKHIKIKDRTSLVRDAFSNGVINNDSNGYASYIQNYEKQKKKLEEFDELKDKVDSLTSDISDLKSMMTEFIRSAKNDN